MKKKVSKKTAAKAAKVKTKKVKSKETLEFLTRDKFRSKLLKSTLPRMIDMLRGQLPLAIWADGKEFKVGLFASAEAAEPDFTGSDGNLIIALNQAVTAWRNAAK